MLEYHNFDLSIIMFPFLMLIDSPKNDDHHGEGYRASRRDVDENN